MENVGEEPPTPTPMPDLVNCLIVLSYIFHGKDVRQWSKVLENQDSYKINLNVFHDIMKKSLFTQWLWTTPETTQQKPLY